MIYHSISNGSISSKEPHSTCNDNDTAQRGSYHTPIQAPTLCQNISFWRVQLQFASTFSSRRQFAEPLDGENKVLLNRNTIPVGNKKQFSHLLWLALEITATFLSLQSNCSKRPAPSKGDGALTQNGCPGTGEAEGEQCCSSCRCVTEAMALQSSLCMLIIIVIKHNPRATTSAIGNLMIEKSSKDFEEKYRVFFHHYYFKILLSRLLSDIKGYQSDYKQSIQRGIWALQWTAQAAAAFSSEVSALPCLLKGFPAKSALLVWHWET